MAQYKGCYLIGAVNGINSGTTIPWPSLFFDSSMFSKVNVLFNIGTLTGSPASFSVQELFSDNGYLETGNTGSLTSSGVYWITKDIVASAGTIPTNIKQTSPILGLGREKRVVISINNNATVTGSIYMIPTEG